MNAPNAPRPFSSARSPIIPWLFCLCIQLIGIGPLFALDQAPRDVRFVEKKLEELSNTTTTDSQVALAIKPEKWRHAETENFIYHYRRVTEAQKVVHEIEYHLWFVAKTLGASKERYLRKSHVFIFEDEAEWKTFLAQTDMPDWCTSFARGDELFLNVRNTVGGFDSRTLAHETTHAVVARLYPQTRWPLWLSEGFAEYMGGASVGARKGITAKFYQQALRNGDLSVADLTAMTAYPSKREDVRALYQSAERLVRFLMNELPKERFPIFIDKILEGKPFEPAFMEVYGDKIKTFDSFSRRYALFVK